MKPNTYQLIINITIFTSIDVFATVGMDHPKNLTLYNVYNHKSSSPSISEILFSQTFLHDSSPLQ